MNTKNNRRAQDSTERIVRAVYSYIWEKHRPLSKITVREVCEKAQINRSTFYAHFPDVFAVAESVEKTMALQAGEAFLSVPGDDDFMKNGFVSIFRFMQQYRQFYLIFLEESRRSHAVDLMNLGYQEKLAAVTPQDFGYRTKEELHYAQEFFKAGTAALIYQWLLRDCRETPEELYEILRHQCGHGWPFGTGD